MPKIIKFDTVFYNRDRLEDIAQNDPNTIFVFGDNLKDKSKGLFVKRDGSGNQASMLVAKDGSDGYNHPQAHGFVTCPASGTPYPMIPGGDATNDPEKRKVIAIIKEQYDQLRQLIDQGKSLHIPVIKDGTTGEVQISLGLNVGKFNEHTDIMELMNDQSIELANYAISKGYEIEGYVPRSKTQNLNISSALQKKAYDVGEPLRRKREAGKSAFQGLTLEEMSPAEKQARLTELWDAFANGGMKLDKLDETIDELKKFPEVANNPKADKAFADARRIVRCQTAQELDAEYLEAEKLTAQYISSGKKAAGLGLAKDAATSIAGAINPFDIKDTEWKKCQVLLIIFVGPIWGVLKGAEKLTAIGKKEAEKEEKEAGGKLESKFGFKDLIKKDPAATAAKVTPEASKPSQPKVSAADQQEKQQKKYQKEADGGKEYRS